MKRKISLMISLALTLALLFALASPSFAALSQDGKLQFNEDGKFTILQVADTQDIFIANAATISALNKALDAVKPDLVVFTGDNISGSGCFGTLLTEMAIDAIAAPVEARGIPFTLVFGNHDDEGSVSKDEQLKMYQKYENCVAFDAVPEMYGSGTHNLPILSSDGAKDVYNLWLIDSGSYNVDPGASGYDYVHDDQVQWYVETSNALKAANGGTPLPSLAFQHIAVPEIFMIYNETTPGAKDSRNYFGRDLALELNPAMASGHLGEWSCPPNVASSEFAAMAVQGDVKGIVTGHDHVNDFIGTYQGIDFIQSPGIGYFSYGDAAVRGVRVIELDENDTSSYKTHTITNTELFGDSITGKVVGLNDNLSYLGYPISLTVFCKGLVARLFDWLKLFC